jgi:hypothetical protein
LAAQPAPWEVALDAVVWFHRAAPAAAAHAPVAGARALPVTVGALIAYRDTPVGPYHEVLGSPVLLAEWPLPAATIPFIAVDSEPSVQGGRENWALPKTLARFDWPGTVARAFEADAEGEDWSVHATVHVRPRAIPLAGIVRTRQVAGAAFTTRASGRARLATVDLETRGATLPAWLRSGRHPALVIQGARGVVGQPR